MKLLAMKRGGDSDICDLMIAGIAAGHSATLVTRNVRHFDDLPIDVVNPWAT
jgi:toxin FitB